MPEAQIDVKLRIETVFKQLYAAASHSQHQQALPLIFLELAQLQRELICTTNAMKANINDAKGSLDAQLLSLDNLNYQYLSLMQETASFKRNRKMQRIRKYIPRC